MSSSTTLTNVRKFTAAKLGQSNFALWSWEFRLAAQAADVWNIIAGIETIPVITNESTVTQNDIDDWTRREAIAMAQIAKCIDDEMKIKIISKTSSKEIRACLALYYKGKTRREKYRK